MLALAFRSSPRVCLLLPGAVSCAALANSLAFRSGAHEVFLGPYNYPFMHLSPARMKTPISYSSVDRCVLSPYCGLGKTQHPFLLGAFVLAGEIDTGTGSRVATSLTCVRPAPGSVRHTVDPGAVTLTRGAVNEGMGCGSGSHPRTDTYGGRSERSPGPESQGRRVGQSVFCWEFCVLRVPWVLPHLPMLLNAQPASKGNSGARGARSPCTRLCPQCDHSERTSPCSSFPQPDGSQHEVLCPPSRPRTCGSHSWGWEGLLLASNGQRPGMLLKVLQCPDDTTPLPHDTHILNYFWLESFSIQVTGIWPLL